MVNDLYYEKYLKYRNKYTNLQSQIGGMLSNSSGEIVQQVATDKASTSGIKELMTPQKATDKASTSGIKELMTPQEREEMEKRQQLMRDSISKIKESMPPKEELKKLREALQHAMELAEQYKEKLVRPASIVRIESDKDHSWVDWDETTPQIQLDQRISDLKDVVTNMAIIINNTLDRIRNIEDDIEIIPGQIYPGWADAD